MGQLKKENVAFLMGQREYNVAKGAKYLMGHILSNHWLSTMLANNFQVVRLENVLL